MEALNKVIAFQQIQPEDEPRQSVGGILLSHREYNALRLFIAAAKNDRLRERDGEVPVEGWRKARQFKTPPDYETLHYLVSLNLIEHHLTLGWRVTDEGRTVGAFQWKEVDADKVQHELCALWDGVVFSVWMGNGCIMIDYNPNDVNAPHWQAVDLFMETKYPTAKFFVNVPF